jgi:hypothetical protein
MQLSQINKLAFICNLCFALTFMAHFVNFIPKGDFGSAIIVYGQLVAVFLNIGVLAWYGLRRLRGKSAEVDWVLWANSLFLLVQIYYYFFF